MPAKKQRIALSRTTADEVLFLSDRTCCVCRTTGRAVQIHHINEDPSDNDIRNLAVLCLECHNETQIQGGFGRKLGAGLVTRYRDHWLAVVELRRSHHRLEDELRRAHPNGDSPTRTLAEEAHREGGSFRHLGAVLTLLDVRSQQSILLRNLWDSGDGLLQEQGAGTGARFVLVATRVLNDAKKSMDLTCGLAIQTFLIDERDRMFDPIPHLDEFEGNPECNFALQPGFEHDMTWIFRVPEAARIRAFQFEDFTEFGSDRVNPTRIELFV